VAQSDIEIFQTQYSEIFGEKWGARDKLGRDKTARKGMGGTGEK